MISSGNQLLTLMTAGLGLLGSGLVFFAGAVIHNILGGWPMLFTIAGMVTLGFGFALFVGTPVVFAQRQLVSTRTTKYR